MHVIPTIDIPYVFLIFITMANSICNVDLILHYYLLRTCYIYITGVYIHFLLYLLIDLDRHDLVLYDEFGSFNHRY